MQSNNSNCVSGGIACLDTVGIESTILPLNKYNSSTAKYIANHTNPLERRPTMATKVEKKGIKSRLFSEEDNGSDHCP